MKRKRNGFQIIYFVIFIPGFLFLLFSCVSSKTAYDNSFKSSGELNKTQETEVQSTTAAGVDVQVYRDRPIEKIVQTVPGRISKNIGNNPDAVLQDLVRYLTKDETDPFLRVKNLHDWICDNIAYDAEGYFTGNYSGTDYGSVLRSGKSVCDGYAGLFLRMAELSGFRAVKISGHAKGYGFDPVRKESRDSSHAWNGVEIDGEWYLLDCTWDAGHVTTEGFTKEYSTGYLFLKSEYMIFSHHPDQENWQLLKKPVSYQEYLDLHFLQGEWFNYVPLDVTDGDPRQRERFSVNEEAVVDFPKRDDTFITAVLAGDGAMQYENRVYVDNGPDKMTIHAVFPAPGVYRIRLFGFKGMDGQWLGDVIVEAKKGTDARMPLVYSNFIENRFRIIEPESKYLQKGQPNTVAIYAPGWKKVMVKMGGKSHEMEAAGGEIFRLVLPAVTAGEIDIFGTSNKNSHTYQGACKIYAVE